MTLRQIFDLIYERIKHGDEEHQKWLKNELEKLLKELEDK